MFEPLGAKLLGKRVGRHTCWADALFDLDFGVWILDFLFFIPNRMAEFC